MGSRAAAWPRRWGTHAAREGGRGDGRRPAAGSRKGGRPWSVAVGGGGHGGRRERDVPDPAVGHGERDDADVTVHNARSHTHKRSHTKGVHRAAGENALVGRVPRRLAAAAAAVGPPPFCTAVAAAGLEATAPAGGANAWTARSPQAAGGGGRGGGGVAARSRRGVGAGKPPGTPRREGVASHRWRPAFFTRQQHPPPLNRPGEEGGGCGGRWPDGPPPLAAASAHRGAPHPLPWPTWRCSGAGPCARAPCVSVWDPSWWVPPGRPFFPPSGAAGSGAPPGRVPPKTVRILRWPGAHKNGVADGAASPAVGGWWRL